MPIYRLDSLTYLGCDPNRPRPLTIADGTLADRATMAGGWGGEGGYLVPVCHAEDANSSPCVCGFDIGAEGS